MAERSLPSSWKNCATCTHWCGKQTPDTWLQNVKFDPNERAKCVGGVWNNNQVNGTQTCAKWEQRFKR